MKESNYNYYTQYGKDFLCMNGVTGAIVKLKDREFQFLKQLMNNEIMQDNYPALTQKLVQFHFLVNDMEEEFAYLKSLNVKQNNIDVWHLKLNPTQDCNFRCWYCYEKHIKGRMEEDTMNRIKLLVKQIFLEKKIKHFILSWFGGEPLLYFDEIVYPISLYIKELAQENGVKFSNSITTNGFLLTEEKIQKCQEINLLDFQITLDGDKKSHDKIRNQKGRPSFDTILSNCIRLASLESMRILLRINYNTQNIFNDFSQTLNCIPASLRHKFTIQFQRIWQTYEKEGNNEDVKNILNMNFSKLREQGFFISANINYQIFKGTVCYADRTNYVHINYDGKIYRCTANNYTDDESLGYLDEKGNIVWKREEYADIGKVPFFDNKVCCSCQYLAICGGPCFSKWWNFKNAQNKLDICPITNFKPDIDVDTFIREYYRKQLSVKETLKHSYSI